MIKNVRLLKEMEDDFFKKEGKSDFSHSIKIFESMWKEGVKLGVLPPVDPLEGIEIDIKIAKILNSCLKNF